jgi:HK97 family phage major capsid protein
MTPEELEALRAALNETRQAMQTLHGQMDGDGTPEQQAEWDRLDQQERQQVQQIHDAEQADTEARERDERARRVRESRERWASLQTGRTPGNQFERSREIIGRGAQASDWDSRNVVGELLRMTEGRIEREAADERHTRRVLERHLLAEGGEPVQVLADRAWAVQLMTRCLPEYTRAFNAVMRGGPMAAAMLPSEQRAAIAVGTNTQGGFLVPFYLDPTIMFDNDGSANVVRQIARVVTLSPGQGNTWHGMTSAGATGSWDAELEEVSDDSPSFAEPSIPLNTPRTFIKASFQAVEDIPDLAGDIAMMFADARDRLEGAAHCTGTGASNQPTGIVTALDANTNVEVISTTAATIGVVDINGLLRAVPQRYRRNAQWLMNDVYADAIQQLGTAVGASYTGTLATDLSPTLKGKPWNRSDDMPSTQTTTVNDNEIVVGDWSRYVIVDRPGGMSVEYIQNLVGTTNALPTGERGWLAWWRNGADSVLDTAFRLLQDKTSA